MVSSRQSWPHNVTAKQGSPPFFRHPYLSFLFAKLCITSVKVGLWKHTDYRESAIFQPKFAFNYLSWTQPTVKKAKSINGKPLPKTAPDGMLNGAVCAQYKRCGKRNCRCARGELHGPYFYRFQWQEGRVVKEYIRLDDVEKVRAACARYRAMQDKLREGRQHFQLLLSQLRSTLRGLNYE